MLETLYSTGLRQLLAGDDEALFVTDYGDAIGRHDLTDEVK